MIKCFTLRRAHLLLALTLPGLCWGFGPAPKNALIVNETGGIAPVDEAAVTTFLSGRLAAAGYTVTTNLGVPLGSLAGYQQVWDIRFDAVLSGTDDTAYLTYLAAGGSLFVLGENGSCCGTRDASIAALIASAGGGAVVLENNSADAQTVEAPFTGPVTLATVTYADIGGFTAIGNGAFITEDSSSTGGAVVFGPGTMTNAAGGTLLSVLDVNFMDTSGGAEGLSQALTDNLIAYLAAPTVIGRPPPSTPGPPSITLILIGLGMVALFGIYERRKRPPRTHSRVA
jgi:hypothetical protein